MLNYNGHLFSSLVDRLRQLNTSLYKNGDLQNIYPGVLVYIY